MTEEKQKLCTLSQAVDLIAFGTLDVNDKHCFAHQEEQEKAIEKLKYSITRHRIHVFKPNVYGNGWEEVKNLDGSMIIDINRGCIGCSNASSCVGCYNDGGSIWKNIGCSLRGCDNVKN